MMIPVILYLRGGDLVDEDNMLGHGAGYVVERNASLKVPKHLTAIGPFYAGRKVYVSGFPEMEMTVVRKGDTDDYVVCGWWKDRDFLWKHFPVAALCTVPE